MNKQTIPLAIGVLSFSILLCAAIYAWTEPGTGPTGGGINAPINTGNAAQTKSGGLNILEKLGIGNNNPTKPLDVTGDAQASRFCLNNVCCAKWEDCLAAAPTPPSGCTNPASCSGANPCCSGYTCDSGIKKCVATGGGCTITADCAGDQVCLPGGQCGKYPCSVVVPGMKRIFVTSNARLGSEFGASGKKPDDWADSFCREKAAESKLPGAGSYKALVYLGTRNPQTVLNGQLFWNGITSSTDSAKCDVNILNNSDTNGPVSIFAPVGLANKIAGNEAGYKMLNVAVWTNFKPGNAGPNLLTAASMDWPAVYKGLTPNQWCKANYGGSILADWKLHAFNGSEYNDSWSAGTVYVCQTSGLTYVTGHWYGNTSETGEKWSHNAFAAIDVNGNNTAARALYCVEQ